VQWFSTYPGNGANPAGGTLMASGAGGTGGDFSYTWPSDMFGQLVYIAYLPRLQSGSPAGSWTDCMPKYFYGTGS
jgi:hypothetical protein